MTSLGKLLAPFAVCISCTFGATNSYNPYFPFIPPTVPKLHIVEASYKHIIIGWDFQTNAIGYAICYRRFDEDTVACVDVFGTNTLTFGLWNLRPSTDYFFSANARSWTTPNSPLSSELKVTTTEPPPPMAEVRYVQATGSVAGDWPGRFGSEGYSIAGGSRWFSPGVSILEDGSENITQYTWILPTDDGRALIQDPSRTDRIAATFMPYGARSFEISSDVSRHLTFYFLDWDRYSRRQKVDFYDVFSDRLLDSRIVEDFESGTYLTYALKGKVRLMVSSLGGAGHVVSGMFFGGPLASAKPNLSILATGRDLQLNVSGPSGCDVLIESSTNMVNWTTRSTGTLDVFDLRLTLDPTDGLRKAFFRASLKYIPATSAAP